MPLLARLNGVVADDGASVVRVQELNTVVVVACWTLAAVANVEEGKREMVGWVWRVTEMRLWWCRLESRMPWLYREEGEKRVKQRSLVMA